MTNSILISKTIYELLNASKNLKSYVDERIYPLVAESDTSFPFITYSRDSVSPSSHTKDGLHEDTVSFSILVVSNNYLNSLEIANICRGIFEKRKITSDDLVLEYTELVGIVEEFMDDSYTQSLKFTGVVRNNN